MSAAQQLQQQVAARLHALRNQKRSETALHDLHDMVKTDEGMEVAAAAVFNICVTQGISVQQAMAFYDQEL